MKSTKEKIDVFARTELLRAKKMTLGKYSNKKGWPIPFGMSKKENGFQVFFADGESTWMDSESFYARYRKEGATA